MAAIVATDRLDGYHDNRHKLSLTMQNLPKGRSSDNSQQPKEANAMTTMRDRYRLHDDESFSHHPATSNHQFHLRDNSPEDRRVAEWRYPLSSAPKRRISQRSPSPSRPRSQQGSTDAQIASIREAENRSRSFQARNHDREDEGNYSRKFARLHQEGSETGGPAQEWLLRKPPMRVSDSEPTSAASSRLNVSHSRTSSTEDDANLRERYNRAPNDPLDYSHEANYVWRSNQADKAKNIQDDRDVKSDGSPPNRLMRQLPPLQTDIPPNAGPGSAPTQGTYQGSSGSSSPQLGSHPGAKPENLMSLSALSSSRPDPTRHYDEQDSSQNPSQDERYSHRDDAYTGSYDGNSRPTASSAQARVQSPHATVPGQAFIHPSLAGLPGAGGGSGSKQQPSFVSKLYSMLEDDTIKEMISWGASGTTFSVANPAEFAKIVLPNWFKHSNWQSFVRQLNMYGFHKVNHTYQGTPDDEIQVWEFKHPSFRRGEIQLLNDIKRKSSRHKRQDSLGRSITAAADYELSGTPSPEMGIGHITSRIPPVAPVAAAPRGYGPPAGTAPASRPSAAHQHSHSFGGSSSTTVYRDYPNPVSNPAASQGPRHISHVRAPSGMNVDGIMMRFDELSDRLDAVIRHATFYDSEVRTMKDQIYQYQQNDSSTRAYVHHLEEQMRLQHDQIYQLQRQVGQTPSANVQPPSPALSFASRVRDTNRLPPPMTSASSYGTRSPNLTQPSYTSPSLHRAGHLTPTSSADAYQRLPARSGASSAILGPPASPAASRKAESP